MEVFISLLLLMAIFGVFVIIIASIAYVVEIVIDGKVYGKKKEAPVYI